MAWIELHQAVWTHRKTFELAARLDLDETYAAAHVIRLWTWALDNSPEGDLSSLSDRAIAFGSGWRGDAETFVAALVDVGWLDPNRQIHDWEEYAGRLAERRRANTERMRAARAQHVRRTEPARVGLPDLTGPDRTGPDLTGPDNPSQTLPLRGKGSAGAGPISGDVVDRLSRLPAELGAASFHAAAEAVLSEIGFTCQREVQVDERGDGHGGRVDLVAERGDERIAFEFDRSTPRQKSIRKLAGVQGAVRVVVLRGPFDGPPPRGLDAVIGNAANGCHPLQEVQVTPATAGDREVWNLARAAAGLGMSPANAEVLDRLEPIGRAADGGLQLRAPPGLGLPRFRNHVARALLDAGDAAPANVAIVEG